MEWRRLVSAQNGEAAANQQHTRDQVAYHAAGGPRGIEQRLAELEQERSIEDRLEAYAAFAGLGGLILALVDRRWLVVPAAVLGWLLQHGMQGWCVPMEVLRRQGFRSAQEIHEERTALKALRGDFQSLPPVTEGRDPRAIEKLLEVVRR
jgi:hypothetical protein